MARKRTTTPKIKRPEPFGVGARVRVRVKKGPREADGRWYWLADTQSGDRRLHVWTGWGTPEEAEAATIAEMATLGIGERVREQVRTVHDLLDTWAAGVEANADLSPVTRRNCRLAAARLSGALGTVLVRELDRLVLERWRNRSTDAGSTLRRDLKYLRQAWAWGREVKIVPAEDLPKIEIRRSAPVRTDYTPEAKEVGKLLRYVGEHSERARRGVILLAAMGGRPSEILALRWRDVAADCTSFAVTGKTGTRRVEVHTVVAAEMATWARHPEIKVVGVSANTIRDHLAEGCAELGIPRVSPTALRRYVVDALYDATPDVSAAAKQMGHSPETAMRHYRRVSAEKQRAAVEAAGVTVPGLSLPAGVENINDHRRESA